MVYAIFTRSRGKDGFRRMHAVEEPAGTRTVCGLPIGTGSGLVRDGDYWKSHACPKCWKREER